MNAEITEGDCIEVMRAMPASSVDAVITDPPYGINYGTLRSNREKTSKQEKKFEMIENDASFDMKWQVAWMRAAYRVLKDDRHFYCFCSEHYVGEFQKAIVEAGFTLKRLLIWKKDQHGIGDMIGGYMPLVEFILFAHKGSRELLRGPQTNVLEVKGIRKMEFHPTEKPTGVLRPLILNSTKVGESVLDPFAGSGSTGVAAREENREPVLIEMNPKYIKVIEGRLAQGGLF